MVCCQENIIPGTGTGTGVSMVDAVVCCLSRILMNDDDLSDRPSARRLSLEGKYAG